LAYLFHALGEYLGFPVSNGAIIRAPRIPLPRDVRGPVFADPSLNRRDKMTLLWGRKALRPGVRSRLGKFRE
jgi:hypothetical protein